MCVYVSSQQAASVRCNRPFSLPVALSRRISSNLKARSGRALPTTLVLLNLSGAPGLGKDSTGLTRHIKSHEPPHINPEHLTGPSV